MVRFRHDPRAAFPPGVRRASLPAPVHAMTERRRFLIYWGGQSVSAMGDAFAFVAIPLLVLESTGSVAQMGLVSALGVVAQVLTSLFAGHLVDAVDRRRLMIACDLGRAAAYAALPLWWMARGPSLPILAAVAFVGGAHGNMFSVAYIAAVPSLVSGDRLNEANAKLQGAQALAYVLGPILAGIVAARTGAAWALGLDALSFLISVASLALVRFSQPAADRASPGAPGASSAWAGPRFVWRHPLLRAVLLLMVVLGLTGNIGLGAGVTDLVVYHMKHDLRLGDRDVGWCLGIAAVGAVAAAVLAPRLRRRFGFGACFLGGTFVQAIGLVLIGLVPREAATALGALLWSAGMLGRAIPSLSMRQALTPPALIGRVMSTFWTTTFGASALGTALVTRLAASVGAGRTFAAVGLAVGSVALVGLATPARMQHPEGQPPRP
jgi:Na+/melibiose symporter-like transporter